MTCPYTFDEQAALRVRKFIETFCRQSKGKFAGQPLSLLTWQWEDVIKPLYGWKRADGTRKYRQAGIWLPKKNGKSTLAASLALYHLIADGEQGAEVYIVANDQQQAGIVYSEAVNMVDQSPLLAKRLDIRKSQKKILHAETRSILRALSSEKSGKHGYNSSLVLVDEVAFLKDRELWDVLRYSTASREQPLIITISTAGYLASESIGKELYDYAKNVKEGKIKDEHFLPCIYEADADGDFRDSEQWYKANPSLGVTLSEVEFKEAVKEAESDPRKEANLRTLRLNQWLGSAAQWLSTPLWDSCGKPFAEDALHGAEAFVGLDLARKHDLAAYVLLFHQGGLYYLLPRFFIPRENAIRKEQVDHAPYMTWAKQGLLTLTDGDVIDYSFIRESLKKDKTQYDIKEIGYDPYNAEQLCNQQLRLEDGFEVVEIKQTMPFLAPATSMFERLLKEKKIRHNGNPVLRWQAGNVAVRQDANQNIMIDKLKSTSRIDGISAAIMALQRQINAPSQPQMPRIWSFDY